MPVKPGRAARRSPLLHDPHKLADARIEAGLSMTRLAEQAGCTVGHLSEIESGSRSPSVPLLRRIADALGCRVRDLRPTPAPDRDVA